MFIRVISEIRSLFTVKCELHTRCQDFQSGSPNSRLPLLDVVLRVPGSVRGSPPVVGATDEGVTRAGFIKILAIRLRFFKVLLLFVHRIVNPIA